MDEPRHLFVYGTLMSRFRHPDAMLLRARARLVGPASVSGALYSLGAYPGLVLAEDVGSPASRSLVHGELYALPSIAGLLARLDRYEGCHPDDPEPWPFGRMIAPTTLSTGRRYNAWVYAYRGPTAGRVRLASGRFLPRS